RADAAKVTLTATFQGCQDEGICYPPMTRKVEIALPAGSVTTATASGAVDIAATSTAAVGTGPQTAGSMLGNERVPGAGFAGEGTGDAVAFSEGEPAPALGMDDADIAADPATQFRQEPAAAGGAAAPGVLLVL